jgi:hypothetical protein
VPLQFGGKTYLASKFNLARLVELERWMRRAPFDLLKTVLADTSDPKPDAFMVRELLAYAWDNSQDMLLFTAAGRRFWMHSIEGITRAIWIAILPNDPALTYEQLLDSMAPEKIEDATNTVAELMGHTRENPTPPAKEPDQKTTTENPTPST